MSNVRTVSDTKRLFYTIHTRPISSIYRRIVEELIVEMHLLSVNIDFSYDAVYALGVVTTFNRFMQGYRPDNDKESIFQALCRAIEADPQQYRSDAEKLSAEASESSKDVLLATLKLTDDAPEGAIKNLVRAIAGSDSFKYSRLFGIGLYSLLEAVNPELVKDKEQIAEMVEAFSSSLSLPEDKLSKDIETYQLSLDKMIQAQIVLSDMVKADRKKREEREAKKSGASTPENEEVTASPDA
ncbi:MAG: photosystem II biogenesis protein Psp29 [Cyanobacteria bacterium P01_A01_bin.37]